MKYSVAGLGIVGLCLGVLMVGDAKAQAIAPVVDTVCASPYAHFEFAPASGAGMGTACSCAPVTGAKGEALTFTRTGPATCSKGNTLTGIADGSLVQCASNQPLVMPGGDGTGPLGVLMDPARVNRLIKAQELCDAAWADVGTPGCAANDLVGPFGTTTMEKLTDDDGAAKEGRSQTAATTNLSQHTVSCYVKAGTATSATIVLEGTGNSTGDCSQTFTDLSTETSTRVWCTSASAYTSGLTAVKVSILVGSDVGTTGTLYAEACQHEAAAPWLSSFIPTDTATVTRNLPAMDWAPTTSSNTISMSAVIIPQWTPTNVTGSPAVISQNGASAASLYVSGTLRFLAGSANPSVAISTTSPVRVYGYDNGTNTGNAWNGAANSVAAGTPANRFGTTLSIGGGAPAGINVLSGVIKQVCVDPDPTRCH